MTKTPRVGGGGKAKNCCKTHWLDWLRERKPWAISKPAKYKQVAKAEKARHERRKARVDPEAAPTYGRYQGWSD